MVAVNAYAEIGEGSERNAGNFNAFATNHPRYGSV